MFSKLNKVPDGSYKYVNLPFQTEELVLVPPPAYFSKNKDYSLMPNECDILLLNETNRCKKRALLNKSSRILDRIEFVSSEPYIVQIGNKIGSSNISNLSIPSTTTSSTRTSLDENNSINMHTSRSSTLASVENFLISSTKNRIIHENQKTEVELLLSKVKLMESRIKELENKKAGTVPSTSKEKELAELSFKSSELAKHEDKETNLYLEDCRQLNALKEKVYNNEVELLASKLKISEMIGSRSSKEQISNSSSISDNMLSQEENQKYTNKSTHQLELCLHLKNELLNNKELEFEKQRESLELLTKQFAEYRAYMERTVIPYLRKERGDVRSVKMHYIKILTELYEAKRIINKQAQNMNFLKSTIHCLTTHNEQMNRNCHY